MSMVVAPLVKSKFDLNMTIRTETQYYSICRIANYQKTDNHNNVFLIHLFPGFLYSHRAILPFPSSKCLIFLAFSFLWHVALGALPLFFVPVVMRIFRTYSSCLEEGGSQRSLAQDTWPRMLPGTCNSSCYAADSDYNPSANDPQHISVRQYVKTILCSITHLSACC